ncbi:MAG TPA: MmgE/PrpD family protein, partial [Burkholderiales bacterium]|nr:MmgE/PrpD family protein [Burkholderiales bacterium]
MARLPVFRGGRHGRRCDRRAARLHGRKRGSAVAEIITGLGPNASITEQLAARVERAREAAADFRETAEKLLLDIAGLCVAARGTDYVRAAIAGWDGAGGCTAIGHGRALDAAGAAFVNGTAAHGEDFDDTFEGGPVHAGAVVVPAVLAAAEREHLKG